MNDSEQFLNAVKPGHNCDTLVYLCLHLSEKLSNA